MGDWAFLSFGPGLDGSRLTERRRWLTAKNNLPLLWQAFFGPQHLRVVEPDDEPPSAAPFVCSRPLAEVKQELALLWAGAEQDPWSRVAWEGLSALRDLLDDLPDHWVCELDFIEQLGTVGSEDLRGELFRSAARLAPLIRRFDGAAARALCRDREPYLCGGSVERDGLRARRWARADNDRAGLFSLYLGWPGDDDSNQRLAPWFAAGGSALPCKPTLEEARILLDELVRRGVVVAESDSWIDRYLEIACRSRSPNALAEVLQVMVSRGMLRVPVAKGAARLTKKRERLLGPGASDDVPVFNLQELASALDVLGD